MYQPIEWINEKKLLQTQEWETSADKYATSLHGLYEVQKEDKSLLIRPTGRLLCMEIPSGKCHH